jgi:hypothetical protein
MHHFATSFHPNWTRLPRPETFFSTKNSSQVENCLELFRFSAMLFPSVNDLP